MDTPTLLRQFVGFLSADVPELHQVEVPRLGESVDRFLKALALPREPRRAALIDETHEEVQARVDPSDG